MSILRNIDPDNGRLSFGKIPKILDLPYLIELQRASYENFLKEGIRETFADISPIEDFTGNLVLEFLDYQLDPRPTPRKNAVTAMPPTRAPSKCAYA